MELQVKTTNVSLLESLELKTALIIKNILKMKIIPHLLKAL